MPSPSVFNAGTSQWVHAAAISDPSAGTTVDAEARTATNSILAALRAKGVIAGATELNLGHTNQGRRNVLRSAISDPSGGATADTELRTAINSILDVLREYGVIAGSDNLTTLILDEDTQALTTTAIANVSGGATVDTNCRTAINSALTAMRSRGLIAQD